MIRAGSVGEVLALRDAQAKRTPFPARTPDPALLTWRVHDRGLGAYGYLIIPGVAFYVVEILVAGDGLRAANVCRRLDHDMSEQAKKEGLGLVTCVPSANVPMIESAKFAGWSVTHVLLERGS